MMPHKLMAEIERYRRNEELQMLRAIRAEAKIEQLQAAIERYCRNEELQMLRAIRAEAKIEQLQAALKLIADDKQNCMPCRRQATRSLEDN